MSRLPIGRPCVPTPIPMRSYTKARLPDTGGMIPSITHTIHLSVAATSSQGTSKSSTGTTKTNPQQPNMSLGKTKVLAHVDDDDQRSVPKSEIDELTQHSGKNLRGYMPSASPSTPPAPHLGARQAADTGPDSQKDKVNSLEEERVRFFPFRRVPEVMIGSELTVGGVRWNTAARRRSRRILPSRYGLPPLSTVGTLAYFCGITGNPQRQQARQGGANRQGAAAGR